MKSLAPVVHRLATLAVFLGALASAGCGGDDAPAPESGSAQDATVWSDPAASGSPDGSAGAPRSARALMDHLLRRVSSGQGPSSDAAFGRDVDAVAAVLWEPDAGGAERVAAQVHVQLANIAGDVASVLLAKPPGTPDATELAIHAAWTAALARAPEVYRAWCAKEGAALLKEREEAVRRMLEGR